VETTFVFVDKVVIVVIDVPVLVTKVIIVVT
jgi:hypothetical protein